MFVPFLKFPEDINVDPGEKINRYHKPDEARFKLMKTKDGATPEDKTVSSTKPKPMGKRGKLLDINPSGS